FGSPSTITPDSKSTLVSKDVGGLRWAISRNADGSISGNVFDPAGGDPQFVWCSQKSESADSYSFACSGTGPCTVSYCQGAWQFISDVGLPKSFCAGGSNVGPTPTPQPGEKCPTNGPPQNLQINCSSLVYFYQAGAVVAGLTSTGGLAAACISDGADTICF